MRNSDEVNDGRKGAAATGHEGVAATGREGAAATGYEGAVVMGVRRKAAELQRGQTSSILVYSVPNRFEVVLFSDESFSNCSFVSSKGGGGFVQWKIPFLFCKQ